jgi:signal transduction histidine kinase
VLKLLTLRQRILAALLGTLALVLGALLGVGDQLAARALWAQVDSEGARTQRLMEAALAPLLVERNPAAAQELLDELRTQGDLAHARVVDAQGREFARTGDAPLADGPAAAPGRQGRGPVVLFGGPLRLAGAEVGQLRFGIDTAGLAQQRRQSLLVLGALAALGLALAAVLGVLLSRVLTRDLERLGAGADQLADATPGLQLPEQGAPDVRALTRSFNRMSLALRERFEALQRQERLLQEANQLLEQRVQERTVELQTARDQAEAANRAKSEFLSRMSHELRTPLNAVVGFAQVLRMKLPEQQQQLAHIERAGWHLLALIDDVLDLSRIETGQLVVSADVVDAGEVIADALRMAHEPMKRQRIVVDDRVAGRTDLVVTADATRLRQVFTNLLSNAAKYNRPGGMVTLDARIDGERVTLAVADTGLGMDAAQLAHLFEPFNRLGAESGSVPGTGIGLVITRQLVHLMGGVLRVSSRPGVGSTFEVELRRARRQPPPSPALARPAEPAADGTVALRELLYVEDNAPNRELMQQVVALRPGWRLRLLDHGAALLQPDAAPPPPDAVVLDLSLPGIDGYALCTRLRRQPGWQALAYAALSANAMASDMRRAQAAGFDRFFAKPLNVPDFLAWLDGLPPRRS